MGKVAIVTDSNSGIRQEAAMRYGIYVLPTPFYIDDELFLEDITLTHEQFYEKLREDVDIKTSQPSPGDVIDLWEKILTEYDEIVHIPLSSGLSSSCETAMMLAEDYDGKVQVVDNKRISVTQWHSVCEAKEMAEAGKSAREIKAILEEVKMDSDIFITLDTLQYLKKGGRLTPAAAAIGTVLNLKPVLRIKGEKLDLFAKTRGWKAAKKKMLTTCRELLETEFADCDVFVDVAYTCSAEEAEEWKKEVQETFPEYEIKMSPLSLSVACHIGPGAKAVAITKKL